MALLPDVWKRKGGLPSLRRSMDDLFDRFFEDWGTSPMIFGETAWAPAVNVEETDNELVLTADIPGIDPKKEMSTRPFPNREWLGGKGIQNAGGYTINENGNYCSTSR